MKTGSRRTIEIAIGACALVAAIGAGLPTVHPSNVHAAPAAPAHSSPPTSEAPPPPPASQAPAYNQVPEYNPGADGGAGGGGGGG
jgi:hypothetical protein